MCWLLVSIASAGFVSALQAAEEQAKKPSVGRRGMQRAALSCPQNLHNITAKPVRRSHTFQVKSLRNQQESDTASFYYQAYERAQLFSPNDDHILFELINLSARLIHGQERNGLWKDFIWGLGRWIIERSWSGASDGLKPMVRNHQGIDVMTLESVPALPIFVERLVAIQKTFDEYWLIQGEGSYARVLKHFQEELKKNIQGVVGQITNTKVKDDSLVVANTVRVVRSILTVAKGYHQEIDKSSLPQDMLLWFEQMPVLGKAADGMTSLVSLARTPADLQLVMANLKMMMRWLDGEFPFHTLNPQGLLGLKSFPKVLQTPFDMGFVEVQESSRPPVFRGIPVALEQLSRERYQHMLLYTLLLLRGNITGLMPVDPVWMANHIAYQDIPLQDLPNGGVGAPAVDVLKASMLSQAQLVLKGIVGAPRLNAALFDLLFSPAGETIETFYLLRMLRELGEMCVSHKDAQCIEQQVTLKRFMESANVREGVDAMATQLANASGQVATAIRDQRAITPTWVATLNAARERLHSAVLPYGEKCALPVDALGRLISAMACHSSQSGKPSAASQPFLPMSQSNSSKP